MGVKASALKNVTRKKKIDLGDGFELEVEYYPRKITLNLNDQLKAATDEREIVNLFFGVVKGWDLQDDDGKVLPIDDEVLGDLGSDILQQIIEKLQENDGPKAETSNA